MELVTVVQKLLRVLLFIPWITLRHQEALFRSNLCSTCSLFLSPSLLSTFYLGTPSDVSAHRLLCLIIIVSVYSLSLQNHLQLS